MGWWLLISFIIVTGWVTWQQVTSPGWQEKHILGSWREEVQAYRCTTIRAQRQLEHLQGLPLRTDRPGPPGQADRALRALRRELDAELDALRRIRLDPLCDLSATPPADFFQRLHAFARWRWKTHDARLHLDKLEQLQAQTRAHLFSLTQQRNEYRRRLRALRARLGQFTPRSSISRRIYPHMVDLTRIALQDTRDRYGFGLGRAYLLLELLSLGWEMLALFDQGSALTRALNLERLLTQIKATEERTYRLISAPLPTSPAALAELEQRIRALRAKLEGIKTRLADIQREQQRFAANLDWLAGLSADRSLRLACQNSSEYFARCRKVWGPVQSGHLWWQQALADGDPLQLCLELQRETAALLRRCQEQPSESSLPALSAQIEALQDKRRKIPRGLKRLRETYQTYLAQQKRLRDEIEQALPQQLDRLQAWLDEIQAPLSLRNEIQLYRSHSCQLQQAVRQPSHAPDEHKTLLEQASALQGSLQTLRHKARAELDALKKQVQRDILRLDDLVKTIVREMNTAPKIHAQHGDVASLIAQNDQANTWVLEDNFSRLYARQGDLRQTIARAERVLEDVQALRKRWAKLQGQARKADKRLADLQQTIHQQRQKARWDLLFDDYAQLHEEVQTLRDEIASLLYKPEDISWLQDVTWQLEKVIQQANEKTPAIRDKLRKLALQDKEFFERGHLEDA